MSEGIEASETATDAFDFNADVKLTVKANPSKVQFVNMTIGTVPGGADQLDGTWRGASVFVPSTGGNFHWDGRPGQQVAFLSDGATGKVVVGLLGFIGAPGKLPGRGASGNGEVIDPVNPQFREAITWKIT
ncbi:hypothetical protein [Streptomyces sp. NPDC058989]|uniref:hypothetical protein n=1 Tax=Streptomyces sp. NPDC058989 TaxID=3346686 RepID=UPI00368789A9